MPKEFGYFVTFHHIMSVQAYLLKAHHRAAGVEGRLISPSLHSVTVNGYGLAYIYSIIYALSQGNLREKGRFRLILGGVVDFNTVSMLFKMLVFGPKTELFFTLSSEIIVQFCFMGKKSR